MARAAKVLAAIGRHSGTTTAFSGNLMSKPEILAAPSTADKPDLDWSQVRETLRMLNLAVAQISGAMVDGDDSVSALGDSFTSMVGNVEVVSLAAKDLPHSDIKEEILRNCSAVSSQMREVIVAFQFYDKLTQRLAHVSNSLMAVGELVADQHQLYNPYAWRGLQEKIKSKYTIESERAMFDALIKGASIEDALAICRTQQKSSRGDDVELF